MKLFEKYRPQSLDDVRGQDKAVSEIRNVLDSEGWGGQAWYLTGPTGTGKTTIARILAKIGAPACQTYEMNAADVTMDTVREIARHAASPSMFGGRAWIVNEAHLLSSRVVSALLDVLETVTEHGRDSIIFTTTWAGSDSLFDDKFDGVPFAGRCNLISLTNRGFAPSIVARLVDIADAEGIDCDADTAAKIVRDLGKDKTRSASSMRDAIQEMQKTCPKHRRARAVLAVA